MILFQTQPSRHRRSVRRCPAGPESGRAVRRKRLLGNAGLPVMASGTHIVPLRVGNAILTTPATDRLMKSHGICIQPMNDPTVPKGAERLRITTGPFHDDGLMNESVVALSEPRDVLGHGTRHGMAAQ